MNHFHLSRAEINWRLVLYIALAVDGVFLADQWFIATAPHWLRLGLVALNAALVAVRAYIDKSPAQGKDAIQEPVPVVGPDGGAVPVKEEEKEPQE